MIFSFALLIYFEETVLATCYQFLQCNNLKLQCYINVISPIHRLNVSHNGVGHMLGWIVLGQQKNILGY